MISAANSSRCLPESEAYGGFQYMAWTCQHPNKNFLTKRAPDGRGHCIFLAATSTGALAVVIPVTDPPRRGPAKCKIEAAQFSVEMVRPAGSANSKDHRGVRQVKKESN